MPLIDIGAMMRGIFTGVLKMFTPKGFWSQGQPQKNWVTELQADQEQDTFSMVIECKLSEMQGWIALNARPALDQFLDLQDGKDLLFADKVPDNPND